MYNFIDCNSYKQLKDLKYRRKFYFYEIKIKCIRMLISDKRLSYNLKFLIKNKYLNFYGLRSNCFRNYCLLNSRSRFVFTFFNLNRSSLKFYLSFGYVSGFRRW